MLRGPVVRAALAGIFLIQAGPAQPAEPVETPATVEAPAGNMAWVEAHGQVRRIVEELRSETRTMRRIAAAQKELMDWNGERARLGLAAMTLRPELCREAEIEKWCRLLPATFGVAEDGR